MGTNICNKAGMYTVGTNTSNKAGTYRRVHTAFVHHYLEAWVVQWSGHWPLVQRVRVRFPDHPARSEVNYSGLYVQRSWFTGIKFVVGNLGSFPYGAFEFSCVITVSKGYMHTICPSSPNNSSLRGG